MNYFVTIFPDGNIALRQSESAIYTHSSGLQDAEGWGELSFHKAEQNGVSALKTFLNRTGRQWLGSGVFEARQIDRKTFNALKAGKITSADLQVETAL